MHLIKTLTVVLGFTLSVACAENSQPLSSEGSVEWQTGMDTLVFWQGYVKIKGGLTWGQSSEYPEYAKVKEGDTFMVELAQGVCLMEFFHNRWRRANDVRRWDDSINEYSGCPYVFD